MVAPICLFCRGVYIVLLAELFDMINWHYRRNLVLCADICCIDILFKSVTTCCKLDNWRMKLIQIRGWCKENIMVVWVFMYKTYVVELTVLWRIQYVGVQAEQRKVGSWLIVVLWVQMVGSAKDVLCWRPFELYHQTKYLEWPYFCRLFVLILFLDIYEIFPFLMICRISMVLCMGPIECLLSNKCCAYFEVPSYL